LFQANGDAKEKREKPLFARTLLDGEEINVFHAMKCRKAYFALLKTRGMK